MALALCVPLVLLLVPVFLNRSRASRIFAEGLLGEGICPSCGYNFAGLERRPGTLLVCPECGSSWQSERIGRAVADTESTPAESELERALRPEALRTVRDDRRRITIQQDYTLRAAIRWATDKAHRDRLRSVQRKLKRRGRGVRVLSGVLVISALAVLMLIMQPYIDPRQFVISLMVGSLLAPVIWFGSLGRGGGRRIQTGLKRAGLCPSCGADLSGLGEEPDGCRVCTVCRSAWRLAA